MTHLFRFGFETPTQFVNNAENGWDDEDSAAVWIEGGDEQEAIAWGSKIADAFVAWQFDQTADHGYVWSQVGFANWIETDYNQLELAKASGRNPTVQIGEFPDFSQL